ncbi:DUF6159 family protein [Legionella sp. 16cNR16C]|uniref:DUF6159 family protein n=1 Tax=Legionella sp. 16cNR16C TaxID=2905656 RepID=UPI001E4F0ACF|nr:DUF6159 family protein [Legionella sp. 16cNR16C]MCE3045932.1 DUF6159 family protein [Legionella sp. 16cNR16C]
MSYAQRFHAGWQFLVSCFRFLMKNPALLILPILSMLAVIIAVAGLFVGSFFEFNNIMHLYQYQKPLFFIVILAFYFLLAFITIFFNASLITCVIHRLQGHKMNIFQAMGSTLKKTVPLLGWTLISATIATFFHYLERSHSTVADILSAIFGFSWSVITYFVMPVMVAENVGPITAIRQSVRMLGKGWRKLLIVNFILFLIIAAIVAVFCLIANLLKPQIQAVANEYSMAFILIFIGLWLIVNTTFNAIFNSALYLYIKGDHPPEFDSQVIRDLIVNKKNIELPVNLKNR